MISVHQLSTELQLLILLSYPNAATLWPERIAALIPLINQAHFIRLVRYHRVAMAVNRNLSSSWRQLFSAVFLIQLEKIALQQKQQVMQQYLQQSQLQKIFNEAGISHRVFKGLALSQQLYGDLGWRFSRDIDLLIHAHDRERAVNISRQLGYVSEFDTLPIGALGTRMRMALKKDTCLKNVGGTIIELHVRLDCSDSQFSRFMTDFFLAKQSGFSVAEFVYLCVHAAKSQCHRVKWLIDVAVYAAELQKQSQNWYDEAVVFSKQYGVLPQFRQMVQLVDMTFKGSLINYNMVPYPNDKRAIHAVFLSWEQAALSNRADWKSIAKPFFIESNLSDSLKLAINFMFSPNDHDVKVLNTLPLPLNYLFVPLLPVYKIARFSIRFVSLKIGKRNHESAT